VTEPPVVAPSEDPVDEPSPPGVLPGHCPHCGAPHEPSQEYCLECGERLPRPYVVRRELWTRGSPVWLWAALLALFLVALAGTVLALLYTNDDQGATKVVSTGPTSSPVGTIETATTSTLPATITIPPATSGSITIPTFTSTTTTTSTTIGGTSGLTEWPSSKNGYTIVLQSDPTSKGRAKPEATAQRALNAGLSEVGILNSSNFSSLNPGYYVVFTGIYDSAGEANSHLGSARSAGFPLAYTRQVSH